MVSDAAARLDLRRVRPVIAVEHVGLRRAGGRLRDWLGENHGHDRPVIAVARSDAGARWAAGNDREILLDGDERGRKFIEGRAHGSKSRVHDTIPAEIDLELLRGIAQREAIDSGGGRMHDGPAQLPRLSVRAGDQDAEIGGGRGVGEGPREDRV